MSNDHHQHHAGCHHHVEDKADGCIDENHDFGDFVAPRAAEGRETG